MRGNTPAAGIRQMGRLLSTRTVWDDFTVHVQKDAKLWAFLVALLAAVRAVLMTTHSGQLDRTTGAAALLAAFASGLRYDCQVATWVIVPVLLASVVGSATASTGLPDRVRLGLGTAVVALSVVIGGIDLGYVGEYGNQFDHFVLGLVFDDFRAIVATIWTGYPVGWGLLAMFVLVDGLVWSVGRWLRRPFIDAPATRRSIPTLARGMLVAVLAVVVVAGVRGGSLGSRPLQEKDAATTPDHFLNRLIPTPYHALWQAVADYLKLQRAAGLTAYVPDGNVARAARILFPDQPPHSTVDDYLVRVAAGSADPPRHLLLLIMESYDAWPLADRYRSLGLTEGVRELGRTGILVTRFVPASTGTMSSLGALLTGLPDVNVYTHHELSPSVQCRCALQRVRPAGHASLVGAALRRKDQSRHVRTPLVLGPRRRALHWRHGPASAQGAVRPDGRSLVQAFPQSHAGLLGAEHGSAPAVRPVCVERGPAA